jgi:AcrR family transcriptional regulator
MVAQSEARERLLDAAERLFATRGFNAVKLKDIAAAAGIRHATVYHHVPDGKEQLYIEVMERNLVRHREGIEQSLAEGGEDVRAQLRAVAVWLLSQPPLDLLRLTQSDMAAIDASEARRLSQMALEVLIEPIARSLYAAQARGEIGHTDLGLVAGGFFGMIESLHLIPAEFVQEGRQAMADTLINVLLNGLLPR